MNLNMVLFGNGCPYRFEYGVFCNFEHLPIKPLQIMLNVSTLKLALSAK